MSLERPSVSIFTESGVTSGFGHLVRCTALYDAFEAAGCAVTLVLAADNVPALVGSRTIQRMIWQNDDRAFAANPLDIVVIDSYIAGEHAYLTAAARSRVGVWLDDTDRLNYPAGFVVRTGMNAGQLPMPVSPGVAYLVGPKYFLLRRELLHARGRTTDAPVSSVLLALGGTDARGIADLVEAAIVAARPGVTVNRMSGGLTVEQVRVLFAHSDAAISAAGQTLYELAHAGIACHAIQVAENQRGNVEGWDHAGFLAGHSSWDDADLSDAVSASLDRLDDPSFRAARAEIGMRIVDGRGAARVARAAISRLVAPHVDLRRAAAEDSDFLLNLANDPIVRANSLQGAQIAREQHEEWLRRVLTDASRRLSIVEIDGLAVGQVRLDREGATAVVSISLMEKWRGRGVAELVLRLANDLAQRTWPDLHALHATVKRENRPSQRVFEAAGFRPAPYQDNEGGTITYEFRLNEADTK